MFYISPPIDRPQVGRQIAGWLPPSTYRQVHLNFVIDAEHCVACLACVRVCPTDAIAVAGDEPLLLQVVDEACIRCGQCLPACPHGAVKVNGEIGRALAIASAGRRGAHPEPRVGGALLPGHARAADQRLLRGRVPRRSPAASSATNSLRRNTLSCGKRSPGAPSSASTDPVVVETVRAQYPELLPYLAPVTLPAVAEARYLRAQHGPGLRIAYAGVLPAGQQPRSRRGHHVRRSGPAVPHPRGERAGAADACSSGCRRSGGGT